ncbi:MAG: hypothetical protein ACE5QW_08865 [Thermoplasmata archaeon]
MIGSEKILVALLLSTVLVGTGALGTVGNQAPVEDESYADLVDFGSKPEELLSEFPELQELRERDDFVRIGFFARWGLLAYELREEEVEEIGDSDEPTEDLRIMVPWDGFIQVTKGSVRLIRPILFEFGGEYGVGTDDLVYPQTNRFVMEWRSSTVPHWDGILMLLVIPKAVPEVHVTFHTEPWSRIFEAHQLMGLHLRLPVGDKGHEIEISSLLVDKRLEEPEFAALGFCARWGQFGEPGEDPEMVPWDGFLSTTRGAIDRIKPLRFEHGGEYEKGMDDLIYLRTNRLTVEWRSSTTVNWDGICSVIIVPLIRFPEVHVTFHTDQWSHIFPMRKLVGLHVVIPIDDKGNAVEVRSKVLWKGKILRMEAEIMDMDGDGARNDVLFHAFVNDEPAVGARITVNDWFIGEADGQGTLFALNLESGEYVALATLEDLETRIAFEIG